MLSFVAVLCVALFWLLVISYAVVVHSVGLLVDLLASLLFDVPVAFSLSVGRLCGCVGCVTCELVLLAL